MPESGEQVERRCPFKEPDLDKDACLDKDLMDTFYDLLDDVIYNTNIHLEAEGLSPIEDTREAELRITEFDPPKECIEFDDWDAIYSYLENTVIITGRTPKYVMTQGGDAFPDPESETDIEQWEGCNGYWESLNEVYECIDCPKSDESPAKRIDEAEDECLTYNMINCLWHVLNCLAYGSCYEDCYCPECKYPCEPCSDCLTVVVDVIGYGLPPAPPLTQHCLFEIESPQGETPVNQCRKFYTGGTRLRDNYQEKTSNSFYGWFWLVGTGVYTRGFLPWTGVSPTPQFAWIGGGFDFTIPQIKSGEGCEAFEDGETGVRKVTFNDPKTDHYFFSGNAVPIANDSGMQLGEMHLRVYFGTAACDEPYHLGNAESYQIINYEGRIFVDENCSAGGGEAFDGILRGGGPWSGSGDYQGKYVSAEIAFDNDFCAYVLTISCGQVGELWQGVKLGCGGPDGTYRKISGIGYSSLSVAEYTE